MRNLTEKLLNIRNIRLEPLYWEGKDTRKRVVTDSNNELLGVVGRNYVPIGYGDLYGQVSEWLPNAKIISSAKGGMNYSKGIITMELPNTYDLNGQEIKTYVNLINSLDGSWPIGLIISPLRVVCTNQFVLLRKKAFIEIKQKHTSTGVIRFQKEMRLISDVYNVLEGQLEVARKLIDMPCTTAEGIRFLDNLLNKKVIAQKTYKKAVELHQNPIRKEDEPRNYWSLFNSVTDFLNVELREKQKTSTFANIERVGEVFTELAVA